MTLSAAPALAGPFDGNDLATEFSFDFKVFEATDLLVVKLDALAAETTLVYGVDYSIALNVDQNLDPGGVVTYPISGAPLAAGERLTLTTQLDVKQDTDLTNLGLFYPQTVEDMVDRSVALTRQIQTENARSLRLPLSLSDADPNLPVPVPGAALVWNETGDAILNGVPTESLVALSGYMANVIQAEDAAEARSDIGAAADVAVVKLTGAQTVAGVKTFSDKPIIPDGTAAQNPVSKAQLDAAAPAGCVQFFAMSTPPTGWLKANGAAISRTTYATLFAAIGTTFGVGDGSTTFNLPDLRGEFVRGFDDAKGTDSGRVFGTAQAGQMPSHTHTQEISNSTAGGTNRGPGSSGAFLQYSGTTTSAGGTENSSENRPRNIALLACIKY